MLRKRRLAPPGFLYQPSQALSVGKAVRRRILRQGKHAAYPDIDPLPRWAIHGEIPITISSVRLLNRDLLPRNHSGTAGLAHDNELQHVGAWNQLGFSRNLNIAV